MDKTLTILSIEDNEADFVLLKKALERIPNLLLNIVNIKNGRDFLKFIKKEDNFKDFPTPNIIILDINLPDVNGREILNIIKEDENYKLIPVIIFSTSDYYSDIEDVYKLHANSYVSKTFDIKILYEKIKIMGEYWLKTNELPDKNNFCFEKRED